MYWKAGIIRWKMHDLAMQYRQKMLKMQLVFESAMSGQITPEKIAAKAPKKTDAAYVKLE